MTLNNHNAANLNRATLQRPDAFNLADTRDLNLSVECHEDFWEAFYQENQLQAIISSDSEELFQEPDDEQNKENEIMQMAPAII